MADSTLTNPDLTPSIEELNRAYETLQEKKRKQAGYQQKYRDKQKLEQQRIQSQLQELQNRLASLESTHVQTPSCPNPTITSFSTLPTVQPSFSPITSPFAPTNLSGLPSFQSTPSPPSSSTFQLESRVRDLESQLAEKQRELDLALSSKAYIETDKNILLSILEPSRPNIEFMNWLNQTDPALVGFLRDMRLNNAPYLSLLGPFNILTWLNSNNPALATELHSLYQQQQQLQQQQQQQQQQQSQQPIPQHESIPFQSLINQSTNNV